MIFDERKDVAREMVMDFLSTMAPPRGIDPQGLASIISNIADAFARKMPVAGDYRESVSGVLERLRDTHLSNSWPPQAAFVLAMPQGDAMGRRAAESYQMKDPAAHYAGLMGRGETVPETVLWGVIASKLPRRELEAYRNASVMSWTEIYRDDAHSMMRSRYGAGVDRYFANEAAQ